jgi:hypothetical protein
MAGPARKEEHTALPTTPFTKEDIFSIGVTVLYLNRQEPILAEAIGVKLPDDQLKEFIELGRKFSLANPGIATYARDARASVGLHINNLIAEPELKPFMLGVNARTGIHSFRGEIFRMLAVLDGFQLRNLKQMTLGPLPYEKPRA